DPDKAWKIILPDLKTPDLDVALNQYLSHGNYQEYLAPFTDPRPPLEEIPLSEADVHAERARVALAASRSTTDRAAHQEEAQRELATRSSSIPRMRTPSCSASSSPQRRRDRPSPGSSPRPTQRTDAGGSCSGRPSGTKGRAPSVMRRSGRR
ncbi:MAG TPA: hypothetical protein VFN45_09485, partial [Myxococcaceae bacterium]|nr:hypothetical protein [Myxococcaceae bacterium]